MISHRPNSESDQLLMGGRQNGRSWARTLIEIGLIVSLCYLVGGSPPPSVNEPHYLGKAKQYWNPAWCAGDFFLESADAHEVFYWTFGWLTQFLSLSATAWVGRAIVWALFAISWLVLVRRITATRWAAVVSAVLLLPLIHYGHLAGEWLIGGIEAKGFAWPLFSSALPKQLKDAGGASGRYLESRHPFIFSSVAGPWSRACWRGPCVAAKRIFRSSNSQSGW